LRLVLVGHTDTVWSGAIAPDGSWLVTIGLDASARIWDPATGTCRHALLGHTKMVIDCATAPDGSWLVTVGADD
jgi:WD40 repeat protein